MKIVVFVFIWLLSSSVVSGKEISDLDQLIKLALENNPKIKAERARFEASLLRPSQKGALPNPVVGIKYRNAGFDKLTLGKDEMSHLEFSFQQEIPFPGKLGLKEDISKTEADIQRWKTTAVTLKILSELKQTWYEWFLVGKAIYITQKNLDLLEKFEEIARTKYEVGKGIQQDPIRAQVETSKFIEKLEVLEKRKKTLEARLAELSNLPFGISLGNPPKEIKKTELKLEVTKLLELAKRHSPLLNSQKENITKKEKELFLARKDLLPDLIINTAYANRGFGDQKLEGIWELKVGFRVPLYFWQREKPKIEEATKNLEGTKNSYADAINSVSFMIKEQIFKLQTADNLLELYKNGIIPQAKLSVDSAASAYQVGKVDFLTLLDSIITLFTFELEYYNQLALHQQALAFLEEIVGVELINHEGKNQYHSKGEKR